MVMTRSSVLLENSLLRIEDDDTIFYEPSSEGWLVRPLWITQFFQDTIDLPGNHY